MTAPKIPAGPEGQKMREAFAALNLNPDNPDHWFKVLQHYIEGGAKKRASAGRPKEWTDEQKMRLAADVALLRAFEHPTMSSVSSLCRILSKRLAYREFKPSTLRKKVYEAWESVAGAHTGASLELEYLMANYKMPNGKNSRRAFEVWMKTGTWDFFVDKSGNMRAVPHGLIPVAK
jgi:hypothetical protein